MNYMRQKFSERKEPNGREKKFHLSLKKKNWALSRQREPDKENDANSVNRDADIYNFHDDGICDAETSPLGSQNYVLRLEESVSLSSGEKLPFNYGLDESGRARTQTNTTVSISDSNNSCSSGDNSRRRNTTRKNIYRANPTPFYSEQSVATIVIESSDSEDDGLFGRENRGRGMISLDSDDDSVLKTLKIGKEDPFDRLKRSAEFPKSVEGLSYGSGKSLAKIDASIGYGGRNSSRASSSTNFSADSDALRNGGGLSRQKIISESSSTDGEAVFERTGAGRFCHSDRSKLNSSGGSKRKSLSSDNSFSPRGEKSGIVTSRSNSRPPAPMKTYDCVKLTKKDAERIFEGVKPGNSYWTPKAGPAFSKPDIESSLSQSQGQKSGKIINETASELVMSDSSSEDEVISGSSPDLKPAKTHISRFVHPPNQEQQYTSLSDRKKTEISHWLMNSTPGSGSSTSIISDSNRNSSFGNSSLERFELKHETPNNRGRLSKPNTSEKVESGLRGLDRFIYRGKTSVLKNQTPVGVRDLPEATRPVDTTPCNNTETVQPKKSLPVVKDVQNLHIEDCADILDKLYGNLWRNKADAVLTPQIEQRSNKNPRNKDSRLSKTERKYKPVPGNRIIISSSEEEDFDAFTKEIRPNFNSTKKKAPRSSFIDDKSPSENSSESFYQTALTNPTEWKDDLRLPKAVPTSLSTIKAVAICDSDSDDDLNYPRISDKDLNKKRLSFSEDASDSSTSEFDPGEVVPPKPKAKKAIAKPVGQTPKYTNGKGPSGHNFSETRSKSFLASLSATVPIQNCHPEARVFRDNYKNKKEELCKFLFRLYNKEIFEGKLPNDMSIEWNVRMRGTAGFCYNRKSVKALGGIVRSSRIVLATKILDTPDRLRDTLIHEMCHAAAWLINNVSDGHGPFWKGWASKAVKVFPELPPIKRCHDYKIKTKFTYRCTKCGYSIGRHSKSLNIESKRCGHCYGKFELLVNRTTRSGTGQVATPVQARLPTGFALFVKENYHSVKKDRRSIKHGEVMKILGQQFSAIKIGKKTANDIRT